MRERRTLISAGLLLYRTREGAVEVLLGHPGGPFWAKRDEGAWSIPKGEVEPGEDVLQAARRETEEETGLTPGEPFLPLGHIRQKSGKIVHAWAVLVDADVSACVSNRIEIEWPPRSGHRIDIPEIDRVEYFTVETARTKINVGQVELLDRLEELLRVRAAHEPA